MPVNTTNDNSLQLHDSLRRMPLPNLDLVGGGTGNVSSSVFLEHLRRTAGSNQLRYRLVDFTDEACLTDGDGVSEGGPSDEPAYLHSADEDKDDLHFEEVLLPSTTPGPGPCSLLSVGQSFTGSQRLSTSSSTRSSEDWKLVVRIQGLDLARGSLCGVMEAMNIPQATSPVVTFWEGEIIDNLNHTFLTQKWGATRDIDLKHWRKFLLGFIPMESEVSRHAGRTSQLATSPYIFMRWKENFFVNNESFGLTIAGFYYVCLDRMTGTVTGYYFDPNSAPFQFMSLQSVACEGGGMSFGSYALS